MEMDGKSSNKCVCQVSSLCAGWIMIAFPVIGKTEKGLLVVRVKVRVLISQSYCGKDQELIFGPVPFGLPIRH